MRPVATLCLLVLPCGDDHSSCCVVNAWRLRLRQAYIIFQIHAYNVYHKHGFLRFAEEEESKDDATKWCNLVVDDSKTLACLDDFSDTFEDMLACCDANDAEGGARLERILSTIRAPTPFVMRVVELCNV